MILKFENLFSKGDKKNQINKIKNKHWNVLGNHMPGCSFKGFNREYILDLNRGGKFDGI